MIDRSFGRHVKATVRLWTAAHNRPSAFGPVAESLVREYEGQSRQLIQAVRQDRTTASTARRLAKEGAESLKAALLEAAGKASARPEPLLARALRPAVQSARQRPADAQAETNALLRKVLTELEMVSRAPALVSATHTTSKLGATPVPSPAKLLAMIQRADDEGDLAGAEWSRRQLEQLRPMISEADDVAKVELALVRPGEVSGVAIGDYLAKLSQAPPEARLAVAAAAVDRGDVNCQIASYLVSRDLGDDQAQPFAAVLQKSSPAALETLSQFEADGRDAEVQAAAAHAALASSKIDAIAELRDLGPVPAPPRPHGFGLGSGHAEAAAGVISAIQKATT